MNAEHMAQALRRMADFERVNAGKLRTTADVPNYIAEREGAKDTLRRSLGLDDATWKPFDDKFQADARELHAQLGPTVANFYVGAAETGLLIGLIALELAGDYKPAVVDG